MATASGQVTNAVFGFTSMLVNLLKDHRPDGIAVAFDLPQPTFRHELVDDYKAGRAEAPDILRQQLGLVRQVVEALQIPLLEVAGFEADDIIATLEARVRKNAEATPLIRTVPIELDVDDLKMGGWDQDEVRNLFNFLEFRTLWDRLLEATAGAADVTTSSAAGEALEIETLRL